MAKDEAMGKPSVEDCVKDACREVVEMKANNSQENVWSALREELKSRTD